MKYYQIDEETLKTIIKRAIILGQVYHRDPIESLMKDFSKHIGTVIEEIKIEKE